MSTLFNNNDPQYLQNVQYKDEVNLLRRVALHERFSTNKQGWHQWVFSLLNLQPGESVLDVGCGTGILWSNNLQKIPSTCHILLTDFSPGIVERVRKKFIDFPCDIDFKLMNAEQLTLSDASVDLVAANHMLYHVHDRPRALQEIARVLTPGGRLIASTNGVNHLRELDELVAAFFPEASAWTDNHVRNFGLENGTEQLQTFFSRVETQVFHDQLVVTETQPLVDYILSLPLGENRDPAVIEKVTEHIQKQIHDTGSFIITKSAGAFVCYT